MSETTIRIIAAVDLGHATCQYPIQSNALIHYLLWVSKQHVSINHVQGTLEVRISFEKDGLWIFFQSKLDCMKST